MTEQNGTSKTEDETAEESIYRLLGDYSFYDDRIEILVNCLVGELLEHGLPDQKGEELQRELQSVLDKYELLMPQGTPN